MLIGIATYFRSPQFRVTERIIYNIPSYYRSISELEIKLRVTSFPRIDDRFSSKKGIKICNFKKMGD